MGRCLSLLMGVLVMSLALPAWAVTSDLRPGKYLREGDTGALTITPGKGRVNRFLIESIGANCHTCWVEGNLIGLQGIADEMQGQTETACHVGIRVRGTVIEVSPLTEDACRLHCGARGFFDGRYKRPPKACTKQSQQAREDEFLRRYRAHHHLSAVSLLQGLLSECGEFIDWISRDRRLNDLAMAQWHAGQPAACRATLAQTLASRHPDAEALKAALPPCDFDNYELVAKSTWHNLALCESPPTRQQALATPPSRHRGSGNP